MIVWRLTGHEVDFLIDLGVKLLPLEAKLSETVTRNHLRDLLYYRRIAGERAGRGILLYAGRRVFEREGVAIRPWFCL